MKWYVDEYIFNRKKKKTWNDKIFNRKMENHKLLKLKIYLLFNINKYYKYVDLYRDRK